jgi:DNA-binding IclR family transcriptional regulator
MKRLFTILSAFTMDHYRLTIEQLSNRTRIPQSSIYRILKSFLENGYIVKGEYGTFKIWPAILQLGRIAETGYGVQEIAIPWMERLRDKTEGATISLWVRFGNERLCIESREPRKLKLNTLRTLATKNLFTTAPPAKCY